MMDASTMLMSKDGVTRPVERSAFRTVWSKVGWTEAEDGAQVSPIVNNKVDGLSFEGRPPITVEEHLELAEKSEAANLEAVEEAEDAADDSDDKPGDEQPEKPKTKAELAKEKRQAASTGSGDSDQSPTDQ